MPFKQSGEILPISFSLSTDSDAPLFGVDFEVAAATEDVRIAWADSPPGYFDGLELAGGALPADRFRAVRGQRLGAIDRSLGADGAPVPFVTIGVEVVNPAPFESALEVRAIGALVGRVPQGTSVLGEAPRSPSRVAVGPSFISGYLKLKTGDHFLEFQENGLLLFLEQIIEVLGHAT